MPAIRLSISELPTLDLHTSFDARSAEFLIQVHAGLVRQDGSGDVVPDMAESFEASNDGRVYWFRLRPDLKWTDGAPVRAQDFVFGLAQSLEHAQGGGLFANVIRNATAFADGSVRVGAIGVTAPDDRTVRYELTFPASYFPAMLTTIQAFADRPENRGQSVATALITNGPYRIVEFDSAHIRLTRNESFYDAGTTASVRDVVISVESPDVAFRRFVLGDRDHIGAGSFLEQVRGSPELSTRLRVIPTISTEYVGFNERSSPTNDPRVRRALSSSIDRRELVDEVFLGLGAPAGTFIPPGILGCSPENGARFDLREARSELSGHAAGSGTLRELTLRHSVPPGLPPGVISLDERLASFLIAQWSETLGITVRAEKVEGLRPFMRSLASHPPDLYISGWLADYPDPNNFMGDAFLGQARVWQGIEDVEFERSNARAATERDHAERARLYAELERIVSRERVHVAALFNFPRLPLLKPHVLLPDVDPVHVRDWEIRITERP